MSRKFEALTKLGEDNCQQSARDTDEKTILSYSPDYNLYADGNSITMSHFASGVTLTEARVGNEI